MKEKIVYGCGHEGVVTLYNGYTKEMCEKKIEWFKKEGLCPDCYKKMRERQKQEVIKESQRRKNGFREVEMPYFQYKNEYSHCQIKTGSYNKEEKTVIVYIPMLITPPVSECPICGSKRGCIRQKISGQQLLEVPLGKKDVQLKPQIESFHAKNMTQYVYCMDCQNKLFKVTDDMKLEV